MTGKRLLDDRRGEATGRSMTAMLTIIAAALIGGVAISKMQIVAQGASVQNVGSVCNGIWGACGVAVPPWYDMLAAVLVLVGIGVITWVWITNPVPGEYEEVR